MTNLGQIASNADSARLADKSKKVEPFIIKIPILGSEHMIDIPEGAKIIRKKSDMTYFYRFNPNIKDGFIEIPEGAKQLQWSGYQRNSGHTIYGEPTFY